MHLGNIEDGRITRTYISISQVTTYQMIDSEKMMIKIMQYALNHEKQP